MSRQGAILEIIRITRNRLAGLLSREEHEEQVHAITSREPELQLGIGAATELRP